jgi:hypothetical protein
VEFPPGQRRWLIAGGVLCAILLLYVLARTFRHDRVEGHAFDIPSGRNRIQVEVLNGSGKAGLARLGARRLRRQGIDVVFFGNAGPPGVDTTRVVLRRGTENRAERVRAALGAGVIVTEPDTLRRVDVTVILGPDFEPEQDERP